MEAEAVTITSVPRRRNGRQQACEPCRKRKLACDHSLPTCSRCKRRNAESSCVYLIASGSPARTTRGSDGNLRQRSTRPTTTTNTTSTPIHPVREQQPSHHARPASALHSPLASSSSSITPNSSGAPTSPSIAIDTPGYLGPTSFSAVFREAQGHLSPAPAPVSNADGRYPAGAPPRHAEAPFPHRTSPCKLDRAVSLLQSLPNLKTARLLAEINISPMDAWVRPAAVHMMESMYAVFFGSCDDGADSSHPIVDLRAMAELIFANTATTLKEDVDDPAAWMASFSGKTMRWESVGEIFVIFAFGALELNASNNWEHFRASVAGTALEGREGRAIAIGWKECAAKCAEFCKDEQPSSLLLSLYHKNIVLESMDSGDTSLRSFTLCAEAVALCHYLGMHVDPGAGEDGGGKITASAEARRRACWGIFTIDKIGAICTGRPPLFNRRYISTRMPLDVSDEDLLLPQDQFEEAVRLKLDENGWNRNREKLGPVKYVRARIPMIVIRDEILELALGPADTLQRSYDQLIRLCRDSGRWYNSLPELLNYNHLDIKDSSMSITVLYAKIMLRLEHLQNIFLIERLLKKVGHPDPSDALLQASVEIVSITSALWTHRDRICGLHRDFEWILISYAAPASGVLCMELLQPLRQHASDKHSISRSNIIQQLSLLVGFLDWIDMSAPNARLCCAVKETIERVLAQVLNKPCQPCQPVMRTEPAQSATTTTTTSSTATVSSILDVAEQGGSGGLVDTQASMNGHGAQHHYQHQQQILLQDLDFMTSDITDFFNFDLLDTFDFLRPEPT
ncbi:uncharacterized protein PgNI_00180 [Pyricularia grisea]|uniref:Zn(2)-C6 fungal-type domain-containing protein n=1 Tax=Pyricularia grisea TaxID=148305 RepID=A0A6P8BK81_PYRGI|nr:uncharacterized protein PgNI_00180 [Pyricularia grisea]TLD17301.1 hypothetical protein PgNI_00180 [Pyricularia grisea]